MNIHVKNAQLTSCGCNSNLNFADSVFTSGWGVL